MKTFVIDSINQIAVHGSRNVHAGRGKVRFSSERQLLAATAEWPIARLVGVWNKLPGVKPVKKFTDRPTAIRRLWLEIQALKPQKSTKSELILGLLMQAGGASMEQLIEATGWQSHSLRGFISGHVSKKLGVRVVSTKREGVRVYQIR